MDVPLIVRIDTIDWSNFDFIVGRTPRELEKAGRLCFQYREAAIYIPSKTRRISSFLVDLSKGPETVRRLTDEDYVALDKNEFIGWGYDEPLMLYRPKQFGRYSKLIL